MFSKIVVGTDGFGPASRAVDRAVELARQSGGEVIVVHAQLPAPNSPELMGDRRRGSVDAGEGILNDVKKKHGDSNLRTEMHTGSPAEVLIETAQRESADLIVVGNKGMSKRFHTGTVPNRVSHHAPCNVLIVHTVDE